MYFQHTPTEKMYAVIRYYTVLRGIGAYGLLHRKLLVPRIKTRDPTLYSTFGCVEVSLIAAHAHIIPDFDDPTEGDSEAFFWDVHLP